MSSTREDLVRLVRLQDVYDQIAAAIRDRQSPPPEVQELDEENRRRERELGELQQQVEAMTEELREQRRKESEFELELAHFQKQKGMVTNEREFKAVISEIDYATRGMQEAAAHRKQLEDNIEELEGEIAARREARPEGEAAHRQVVEEWDRTKNELKQRVHDLALEAKRIESEINPKNRSRFLRLLESKKGTAVAPMADGSCSACHFSIRLHLQQRVRRCEEIIFCEHCHRILYSPDAVEVEGGSP